MEKGGVELAILSLSSIPGNWFGGDPATAVRLSHACNEYAAGMVRDHPGRFALWASLPMLDVGASLEEMRYALDDLKADGIGLATCYGDKWPGDPTFKPVFEELNRRKAAVYFHPLSPNCCGNSTAGHRTRRDRSAAGYDARALSLARLLSGTVGKDDAISRWLVLAFARHLGVGRGPHRSRSTPATIRTRTCTISRRTASWPSSPS